MTTTIAMLTIMMVATVVIIFSGAATENVRSECELTKLTGNAASTSGSTVDSWFHCFRCLDALAFRALLFSVETKDVSS